MSILALANSNLEFRALVLRKCKEDTLFWFDNFAWTLDPRRTPSKLPLFLYEGKQIAYLEFLEETLRNPRDIFVDKPRDVGATVITMNFILKHWLFDDNFNARVGSRKEDYVDRQGDPDTLYYKVDYTLDRLPEWMLPEKWKPKHRNHMRLERPDNSNTITGESANSSFARGGRQTVVLFDEIGFWGWARSAWESAGDVTNIRIAMTTPPDTGKMSHAYKLVSGQAGKVKKFEFEHTDIPWKNEQWLEEQRTRRSEAELEREVFKSYAGTLEGKVYAAEWQLYVKENNTDYDPKLPLFVSWDFGLDTTAMVWYQKDMATDQVRVIDSYQNSGKAVEFYVPLITGDIISGLFDYDEKDIAKIRLHQEWRKDVTHFGDPDVKKTSYQTGKTTKDILIEHGIYVQSANTTKKSHQILRERTRMLLRRLQVNQHRCEDFIEAIISSRYPEKMEGNQSTSPITKPIHDMYSHYRTSLEYFADNEPSRQTANNVPKAPVAYTYRPNRSRIRV